MVNAYLIDNIKVHKQQLHSKLYHTYNIRVVNSSLNICNHEAVAVVRDILDMLSNVNSSKVQQIGV